MNRFEVQRISMKDLSLSNFLNEYFLREIPLIISDVGGDWPIHKRRTPSTVLKQLQESASATPIFNYSWYNASKEFLSEDYKTPNFIEHCLSPGYSHVRDQFMRFWVHQKGNITQWHYDGNGLFVFNLHLNGKKKWTIVSPQTPLKSYPFAFWSMPFDLQAPDHDTIFSSFVLGPGDLIYLPPFWQHRVESIDDWNLNLNWVGTRKELSVPSKTLERELKLLSFAKNIPLTCKLMNAIDGSSRLVGGDFNKYFDGYGGSGALSFRKLSQAIPISRVSLFGLSEMNLAVKLRKMPTPWRFEARDLPEYPIQ